MQGLYLLAWAGMEWVGGRHSLSWVGNCVPRAPTGKNSTFLPEALCSAPRVRRVGQAWNQRSCFPFALKADLGGSELEDEEVTSMEPKKFCSQPFLPQ